ncbi:hypothetical protein WR25_13316 [Diploscapter pachys]|uniref:fumarate reductase (NADH) n=1 Tax=Diploscapter pachys TaxID=2018661 RepID=A0A2A2LCG4_9BILA|nr:hypothetical protein WR25_13316 [Diploscapter pachys]
MADPVIIVGGGLAGLSATIEALEGGAKVILIDSEKSLGGNSAKASSGISACNTETQRKLGIEDSRDRFFGDTMSAGDRENDPVLVNVLVDESADAVEFLENNGVDLGDINLCGGHSVPRTHWIPSPKEGKPKPVGFGIISALKDKVNQLNASDPGKLEILLETKVVGLTSWNEYITGANVITGGKKREVEGKAVILTTGGFSADVKEDHSLMQEFAPDKLSLPTTNGAFARGDGVKMARAMGAELIGMNKVQVHPTAFIDPADPGAGTKFLAAEALRGKGAILINSKGLRFGNELGRRDYLTGRIQKECQPIEKFQGGSAGLPVALMLLNDEAADSFGRPGFNFYYMIKKFFVKYDNAEALSKSMGIDYSVLSKTLTSYNDFVVGKADKKKDQFDKSTFPIAFPLDKPLYVALVTPAIHYTMGGLKIDKNAEVFNEFMAKPFKGLFAAGEVTGGVHGSNRLAGNSLLECVVFGRIAGRSAAKIDYSNEKSSFIGKPPIEGTAKHQEL